MQTLRTPISNAGAVAAATLAFGGKRCLRRTQCCLSLLPRAAAKKQRSTIWQGFHSSTVFRAQKDSRKSPKSQPDIREHVLNEIKLPARKSGKFGRAESAPGPSTGVKRNFKALARYLDQFTQSGWVRQKCLVSGIPSDFLPIAMASFKEALEADKVHQLPLSDVFAHLNANTPMDKILIPGFFRFVSQNFPDKVQTLRTLLNLSDLTSPADAYTETRKLKRKLILHVGPTNSGKTYAALQRFIQSNSGIYCGPLRLLAHEVYERMNAQGVPCNLVTGEERRQSDGVDKYAATVEMAPQNVRFDVAIIDEIQMIGDKSRGWAWTHALLGLQADEIHLCGEPTVIPLINALAKETGDEVEINYYDRLTQLTVKSAGLSGELRSLRKGDCIVSFSRQNIFAIKRAIEEKTALRAAVIYGSLPPETRAEQARLFNDPDSPYDVLVASDAIGMGLNLNIRRLIFERVDKWNGETTKKLTISETKQIAGRAGRFGTQFEAGEVCTLDNQDMRYLHQAMRSAAPNVMSAGLHPSLEQLESFAKHLPKETFSSLLERFEDLANLGGRYFLCNLHNLRDIAKLIEKIALTLRDRYVFVLAPTNVKDPISAGAMTALARAHSNGTTMLIGKMLDLPESAPTDLESLRDLEAQHRIIILYMWLAQRFPDTFVEPEATLHFLKRRCEELINLGLASLKFQRKSRKKKKNVQTTPPVDLSTDSDMIDDAELSVSISNDPDPYGIYETDDPSAAPLQNLSNVLELCGIKKSETDRF